MIINRTLVIEYVDSEDISKVDFSEFQLGGVFTANGVSIQAESGKLRISISDISNIKPEAFLKSPEKTMSDFKKEAIKSIRDLTIQLILIAVGVFAITAAFLAKDFSVTGKRVPFLCLLLTAYVLLGFSVYYGYLLNGHLISQLNIEKFESYSDKMMNLGSLQFDLFIWGGVFFLLAMISCPMTDLIIRFCPRFRETYASELPHESDKEGKK